MKKFVYFILIFLFLNTQWVFSSEIIPDFSLETLKNEKVSLNNYLKNNDYSFVVFFTTWCPWCTKQLELFESLKEEVSANVSFIGISLDNNPLKVLRKINDAKVTYPVLIGGAEIASYFNVSGIPVTVLIDSKGNHLEQFVGFRDKKSILENIYKLKPIID
jgi:peroxiredoxin